MAGEGALVEDLEDTVDEEIDKDSANEKPDLDEEEVDDAKPSNKGDDGDDDDKAEDDEPATLDALEAEELEIVETDENAMMLVDEASEIMAIRRAEMTRDVEADAQQGDEFVCQSCFLVLKASQLANKRKMLCVDCV